MRRVLRTHFEHAGKVPGVIHGKGVQYIGFSHGCIGARLYPELINILQPPLPCITPGTFSVVTRRGYRLVGRRVVV